MTLTEKIDTVLYVPFEIQGGSRAGGVIAACWATMVHNGRKTYVENTKMIMKTLNYMIDQLKTIPGIDIVGKPQMAVVAFGERDIVIV